MQEQDTLIAEFDALFEDRLALCSICRSLDCRCDEQTDAYRDEQMRDRDREDEK